jgi:hypothetical protein
MVMRLPESNTIHETPQVLSLLDLWVAAHPDMAVDVAYSLGVLPPDERAGWLIGSENRQPPGQQSVRRLVWYLPPEPPEPDPVPLETAGDIMDLLREIAECQGIQAAGDYAAARGLRPPGEHPDWRLSIIGLDDGPPQLVWTDWADPRQLDATALMNLTAGGTSADTAADPETALTTVGPNGGPDMVLIAADREQRIELWRAHLQGPTAMDACARRLRLTPPADGRQWQAMVAYIDAVGRWNLYWTLVEPYIPQEWPVQASAAQLTRLRDMLATRSGHEVAEAAIEAGVSPPHPTALAIKELVRQGRHELWWIPHPGGEFMALDWFPEPVRAALIEALTGRDDLLLALRLQQELTPRQQHALTSVLRERLTAGQDALDDALDDAVDRAVTRQALQRAAAVVDYVWQQSR